MRSWVQSFRRSNNKPEAPGWSEGLLPPVAERYVGLLLRCLTRTGFGEPRPVVDLSSAPPEELDPELAQSLAGYLQAHELAVVRSTPTDPSDREVGLDWPTEAETMIGMRRLVHLALSAVRLVAEDVPGDLLEAGVWRGGACILMRGVLAALDVEDRSVWVADSFEGLPPPDAETYPADAGDRHWTFSELAVSIDDVRANFARYELLDERVRFLKGWFKDTLAGAPIPRLALLRVDGDMYGSTMEVLDALYDKLSAGGYCIVDDYGAVAGCRAAVEDFRRARGIEEPIEQIDWTGICWRKGR